LRDNESPAYD